MGCRENQIINGTLYTLHRTDTTCTFQFVAEVTAIGVVACAVMTFCALYFIPYLVKNMYKIILNVWCTTPPYLRGWQHDEERGMRIRGVWERLESGAAAAQEISEDNCWESWTRKRWDGQGSGGEILVCEWWQDNFSDAKSEEERGKLLRGHWKEVSPNTGEVRAHGQGSSVREAADLDSSALGVLRAASVTPQTLHSKGADDVHVSTKHVSLKNRG